MSMRAKSSQLIKFCGTLTDPATKTSQEGCGPTHLYLACLPAGRFFARHPDYFIMTHNSHPSPGPGTVKTIYLDPKLIVHLPGLPDARSARSGQVQKTRYPDTLRCRSGQAHANSIKLPGR